MTSANETPVLAALDADSARQFCRELATTVDALIVVLKEETKLVRAARLSEAAAISQEKSIVAERYMRAHGVLRAASQEFSRLAPDEVGHLRERHQSLESAISLNLAVLATARTVSETLIKGVADAVASRQGRQETYGADARCTANAPAAGPMRYNMAL